MKTERDRLKEENSKLKFDIGCISNDKYYLLKEINSLKEENERLKNTIAALASKADSLKQLNSKLVEKIEKRKATVIELINYGDPKDRVKWEYSLRELKKMLEKSKSQ